MANHLVLEHAEAELRKLNLELIQLSVCPNPSPIFLKDGNWWDHIPDFNIRISSHTFLVTIKFPAPMVTCPNMSHIAAESKVKGRYHLHFFRSPFDAHKAINLYLSMKQEFSGTIRLIFQKPPGFFVIEQNFYTVWVDTNPLLPNSRMLMLVWEYHHHYLIRNWLRSFGIDPAFAIMLNTPVS